MILQANPSKKYGNRFSYHSTRKMQSLCCPIQLVVTTLAPKNKLWKRRERRNHLSWLTWALFLAWNRNYRQQTPTLWQPWPQQPAKQSKVTQIEVSSKFVKEKIAAHPLAQMKFCSCPLPNNQVFVSPQNSGHTWCEAKSNKTDFPPATEVFCDCFCWVWRQTLSCVCSAPPPCHLHCQTQSLLTDVGQPPLPGILSQRDQKHSELLIYLFMSVHCWFSPPLNQHFIPPISVLWQSCFIQQSTQSPPCFPVICNLTIHMQMKLVLAKIITVAHGRINNWSLPCLSWGLILL